VRVEASPEAVHFVEEHGGSLYVWAKRARCCHGSITYLERLRVRRLVQRSAEARLGGRALEALEVLVGVGAEVELERR
jgi:hypothetical protein